MIDQYDAFVPGLELMASVTAADGRIRQDNAFAAAVGNSFQACPS
jgi:hypothetical protein